MQDSLIEMMTSNGVVYDGNSIDFRETLKRWIAIYFSGNQYHINGYSLDEKESEEVAFALIGLFDWFERNHDN